MAYGLNIYNNVNSLIVDSNVNTVPQVKETLTYVSSPNYGSSFSSGVISGSIFRPYANGGSIFGATQTSNGWSTGYEEAVVFNTVPTTSPLGTYGLCVYDTNSQITFDSNRKLVKILGRYSLNSTPYSPTVTINFPAPVNGAKIYVQIFSPPYAYVSYGLFGFEEYQWVPKITFVNATTITVYGFWTDNYNYGSWNTHSSYPWYINIFEV